MEKDIEDALMKIDSFYKDMEEHNKEVIEKSALIQQEYNLLLGTYLEKRVQLIDSISNFWQKAFHNHPYLTNLFDEHLLVYLNSIMVKDLVCTPGCFEILFDFRDNPYFSNKHLTQDRCTRSIIEFKEGFVDVASSSTDANVPGRAFFTWYQNPKDFTHDYVAHSIKSDLWVNPLKYFLLWSNRK